MILPAVETRPLEETRPAIAGDLVCARCRARVTRESARVEMNGAHVHTRINPSGDVFQLGCFSEAACRVGGEATTEHTWFPGYAWRFAFCGACPTQLGWRYDGDGSFYGLILDRLASA